MSSSALSRCRVVVAGFALLAAATAWAQLAANSPFLPPQGTTAAPTQNAPLEYRAMMTTPEGETQYRIYDPARKAGAGTWVKLNEHNTDFGVVVKHYDPDHQTLTVEHEGRTLTLPLRVAKTISSGAPQQMMPPPPPGNPMLPAVTQSVAINPTSAQEQQRLDAVAAEVTRRRALREQAASQVGQGGAPQAAVPPGQPPQAQPMANGGQNVPRRSQGIAPSQQKR